MSGSANLPLMVDFRCDTAPWQISSWMPTNVTQPLRGIHTREIVSLGRTNKIFSLTFSVLYHAHRASQIYWDKWLFRQRRLFHGCTPSSSTTTTRSVPNGKLVVVTMKISCNYFQLLLTAGIWRSCQAILGFGNSKAASTEGMYKSMGGYTPNTSIFDLVRVYASWVSWHSMMHLHCLIISMFLFRKNV